jgi:hypothetical protein
MKEGLNFLNIINISYLKERKRETQKDRCNEHKLIAVLRLVDKGKALALFFSNRICTAIQLISVVLYELKLNSTLSQILLI